MITLKNGTIFESQMDTLVNPVNCVGVMGAGLALEFKKRFPDMFLKYKELCMHGQMQPGKLQIYKGAKTILNFPTKIDWRDPSKIEYIESGLKKFVNTYEEKQINSIAFPKLGCGYGGLNWENEVKDLMFDYLNTINCEVEIWVN